MHKPSLVFAALLVLAGLSASFGIAQAVSLPGGNAIFETSLQSRISSTDSSMTLVRNWSAPHHDTSF